MNLDERFREVSVIGAAGKMGSGIALLLAREMALRALADPRGTCVLNLIDVNESALAGLLRYLEEHGAHEGEKQAPRLQALGVDVPAFVQAMLGCVRTGTSLSLARGSRMVFEAAFESEELKTRIYRELATLCPPDTYFFTNTSSIPIGALSAESGLRGRLVGFHFYNPSAVQKLLELITPEDCGVELRALAPEVARALGKTIVPSRDIAGFIGNGHLMRDGLHAIGEVERLAPEHGFRRALCMVDSVSRSWLLRPMGIFQLMDYVGLDVFQLILAVMNRYLAEDLRSDLIDRCVALGLKGGETLAGSQKDGFFRYEKTHPVAVYDPETRDYAPLDDRDVATHLGPHPDPSLSWKTLKADPEREAKLGAHFAALRNDPSLGATLTRRHLQADRRTALKMVEQGVAASAEDVNKVLRLGFMHLYGSINDYV